MTDQPKKSLGQHWLHDQSTLQSICDAAELAEQDTVLEIGPGTGTLTTELLKRTKHVVAVEKDEALAKKLNKQFAHFVIAKNLQLASEDIMRFDLGNLPPDYKVVANIPYYLTSNLIRVLSETPNQPSRVVILVQKEVAERVAAKPGSMSLLSVSAQFYWQVSLGNVVPARLFTPPPKVDSQVLILTRRARPQFPDVNTKRFFRLIKAGFASRRKTLLNSLSAGLRIDKQQTELLLEKAEIDTGLRPQVLSLEMWHRLYEAVQASDSVY